MHPESTLADDAQLRDDALSVASHAPEHERSAFAGKLAILARDAAAALARAEANGASTSAQGARLRRACVALSLLRVEAARSCLFRIADEGTVAVKGVLANALRETRTAEGRAVLIHLLSDDEARSDAILAIGAGPWPEVLPALLDVAEADEHAARVAARAIAKCGAAPGTKEHYAASDFLLDQLDDDAVVGAATDAIVRFGRSFPGVIERARLLTRESGKRKIAGVFLVAVLGNEGNADLLELALGGGKIEGTEVRAFLEPWLREEDTHLREAAERTARAFG